MKHSAWITLTGVLIALVFVAMMTLYVVRTGEVAVVTTWGRPQEPSITAPGLYLKLPWPIQKVFVYDNRLRCLEGITEETYTADHKNLIVMTYTCWRIHDPVQFLQRVGSIKQAEINLEGLVRNYKNGVIGQHPFSDLINPDPQALRFESIESEMLTPVKKEARDRYGIDVAVVAIRKLNLPEAVTEKVFERMRAERKRIADQYQAEGDSEARRIQSEADKKRDELLVVADAKAKRLMADGEAEAAAAYDVFKQNPEFAVFLRKLDVLEATLKEKATVVLGTDTMPYDLLKGSSSGDVPRAGTAPAGTPAR